MNAVMSDFLRRWVDGLLQQMGNATSDPLEFHRAYDQCLWAMVTSGREDLAELVDLFLSKHKPYLDLPIPLQVAAARLMGLEYHDNPTRMRQACSWVALYCDPVEEKEATQGLKARLGES
jgi:hypothetical protein